MMCRFIAVFLMMIMTTAACAQDKLSSADLMKKRDAFFQQIGLDVGTNAKSVVLGAVHYKAGRAMPSARLIVITGQDNFRYIFSARERFAWVQDIEKNPEVSVTFPTHEAKSSLILYGAAVKTGETGGNVHFYFEPKVAKFVTYNAALRQYTTEDYQHNADGNWHLVRRQVVHSD